MNTFNNKCSTILIVDANYEMADLFFRALESKGLYKCFVVTSEFDARNIINTYPIDVVILDLDIARKCNFRFLRYLVSECKHLSVVVDGYLHQLPGLKESLAVGAHGYIVKPLSVLNLRKIMEVFAGK